MARISLRSYNQEIERLIESGRTDEAIAHCRHILQTYPKCVNAYRLLGKAYLESQRYGDAADIFQRVLSAIPEDFVSHVGMSMIREDESNLDEAIWHMERAFEMQPANNAIQEELRRLYGKRDGVEPPKVRLTRGALARMYFKGDLFPQAIAEIRAALAEDPNRLDLQVLLACVYARAGQRVDAAENASAVLRKLPNCLDANRIMADVLTGTERNAEVQAIRQRVIAIDPYAAHVSPKIPSPDQVPDQTISLEKFVWKPGQAAVTGQPAWATSLGVQIGEAGESKEVIPEWLSGVSSGDSQPTAGKLPFEPPRTPAFESEMEFSESTAPGGTVESQPTPSEEGIPEWMRAAGWGLSDGSAEEPSPGLIFEETPEAETDEGAGITQAEIPDWLQAMAPATEPAETSPEAGEDVMPWLDKILPPGQAGETPQFPAEEPSAEKSSPDLQIPDWLATGAVAGAGALAAGEISDWLQEPESGAAAPIPEDELPAWLFEEQAPQPTAEASPVEAELPEAVPSEELPAWLFEEQAPQAPAEVAPVEADLPEAVPSEELPAWLFEEQAPPTTAEVIPVEAELPEAVPSEGLPAWLMEEQAPETLAEVTPVKAELPEAVPSEGLPAWLMEEQAPQPTAEAAPFEAELPEAVPSEELPAWLLEEQSPEIRTEVTPAEAELPEAVPTEELPAWLLEEQAPQPTAEAAPFEAELPEAVPSEELPAWLFEEQAPQPTEEITPVEAELPEAVPSEELPAWLFEEQAPQAPAEVAPIEAELLEAVPAEELPAWLFEEQAPQAPAEIAPIEAELPEAVPSEELLAQFVEAEIPPAAPEPVISAPVEEVMPQPAAQPELSDVDAAFAWLESLAVKQGADEALLLSPEERREAPPEWVQEAIQETAQEAALPPAITEAPPEAELPEEFPIEEMVEAVGTFQEAEAAQVFEEPVEMVAQPSETPVPDWLEQLEEPPADMLADTKPSRPAQPPVEVAPPFTPEPEPTPEPTPAAMPATAPDLTDAEAAFAWLESLAVKQGADEALLLQPDERRETPPEWVLEAAREAEAAETIEAVPTEAEAIPMELQEVETPPVQGVLAEELPAIEQPLAEIAESLESGLLEAPISEAPVEEIPLPEQPVARLSAAEEQDAAFAWMESLAVRQGAEEALLLKPEERRETLPEWVLEGIPPTEAEPTEAPAVEIAEETRLPESQAMPFEEAAEIAPVMEETAPVEPPAPPAPSIEQPAEELPALPTWLTEAAPEAAEEIEWTPPLIKPPSLVELNRASLVELERLPGVGFIMAQQIINFRESHGVFGRVEDLLKVPGFTQPALDEIKDYLFIEAHEAAVPAFVVETRPATGQEALAPAELTEARSALALGDLDKAVASYTMLVRSNSTLDEVILDLEEFIGLYPGHIAVWQCLGDAYLRADQIKKALDAYVRAEKLLR